MKYRCFGLFRLLLAGMVLFQHFAANVAPFGFTQAVQPYEPGSVAVLIFFCLSGFVIAEAVEARYQARPWAFIANRALRIIPHYWVALILSLALHYWLLKNGIFQGERFAPPPLATAFSFTNLLCNFNAFLPGVERTEPYAFIPIVWAVRIEVAFYIVIMLCLWAAKTMSRSWRAVALWALLPLGILFILSLKGMAPPIFGYTPYFVYGAALYFLLQRSWKACALSVLCIPLILVHFSARPQIHLMLGFARAAAMQSLMLAMLLGIMTVLCAVHCRFARALDRQAGAITYPVYIYHYPVLIAASSLLGQGSMNVFYIGVVASIALALLASLVIDPAINRRRDNVRGVTLAKEKLA